MAVTASQQTTVLVSTTFFCPRFKVERDFGSVATAPASWCDAKINAASPLWSLSPNLPYNKSEGSNNRLAIRKAHTKRLW